MFAIRSGPFPVSIPPGAMKQGEEHLSKIRKMLERSDYTAAQKYLKKHSDKLVPQDVAALEKHLAEKIRTRNIFIQRLNRWLASEQGQSHLNTPAGAKWHAKNKAPWWKKWPLWKGDEVDVERMVKNGYELPEEFLEPGRGKKIDVSSFDYDSLQVMNILSISPEAAQARDVQRIGAAYKAEVGFLDAGELTPELAKLVDEGMLTPEEYIKLRKGAPMVMGGKVEDDAKRALFEKWKREQLTKLFEDSSYVLGEKIDINKNPQFEALTTKIIQNLKPTHSTDVESAATIMRSGRLLSTKKQGITIKSLEERGLENKVFFSMGGPYEKYAGPDAIVFVAKKERIYSRADMGATPVDSFIYEDAAEVSGNTITDPLLLEAYYSVYLRNQGKLVPTRKFPQKVFSNYPEITVDEKIDLEDIEAILVSSDDYLRFTSDPLIPEIIKNKLVNVKERFGIDQPVKAYYPYVQLEDLVGVPFDELMGTP